MMFNEIFLKIIIKKEIFGSSGRCPTKTTEI